MMEKYIKYYPMIDYDKPGESRAHDIGLTNSKTNFVKSDDYMSYLVCSVDEVLDGSAPCQASIRNDLRNFLKNKKLRDFIKLI